MMPEIAQQDAPLTVAGVGSPIINSPSTSTAGVVGNKLHCGAQIILRSGRWRKIFSLVRPEQLLSG